jgi:C1A family cysteine protease
MIELGCIKDPADERDLMACSIMPPMEAALPAKASYRPVMTPIKNQGRMGSCVAFATIACRETLEAIYRPKRLPQEDLSELDLYREVKKIDPWDQQGTTIRYAMKILHQKGVATEKACPYTDVYPVKRKTKWWGCGHRRWEKIDSYHRISGINEMKQWLHDYHPFVIGVPVTESMLRVKGKMVPVPKKSDRILGGHAMCVCAYNDARGFLLKNSWGASWGNGGYAWLPYGYVKWCPWKDAWGFKIKVTKRKWLPK